MERSFVHVLPMISTSPCHSKKLSTPSTQLPPPFAIQDFFERRGNGGFSLLRPRFTNDFEIPAQVFCSFFHNFKFCIDRHWPVHRAFRTFVHYSNDLAVSIAKAEPGSL